MGGRDQMITGLMLVGCSSGPEGGPGSFEPAPDLVFGPLVATGSSTIVARGSMLYGVNTWDGTVVRTDRDSRASVSLVVGGEPTRIAAVGEELWVTLRSERSVAVLVDRGPGLEEIARVAVGAEPYGIVASIGDDSALVALSQQDEIIEIDAVSREVVRAWTVHDEPRWLAVHPSGRSLYVSHGFDDVLTRIDLTTEEVYEHPSPPTVSPRGDQPMAGRGTGDPTVSPDGGSLVVPVLYADHLTPGAQPSLVDGQVLAPSLPYYTTLDGQIGRINPALVVHPLGESSGVRDSGATALLVVGSDLGGPVRGSISSATFGPDASHVMATFASSDSVAIVDLATSQPWSEPANGFESRFLTYVDVAANPSGVAITEQGTSWVQEAGTRTVAELPVSDAVRGIEAMVENFGRLDTFHATDRLEAGTSLLDPDLEAGRVLFTSAVDRRVTMPGVGVSCETCHVDGRTDGLTWAFDSEPRQTPSLVGGLSGTLPVTWTENVATVADEALLTAVGRMGGAGLTSIEASQIAAFVDQIRDVDIPDQDADLVALGAEIFERPEVGCAGCHTGPRLTDNAIHPMLGHDVNTPTLVGIAATPPYFHDGSAATLRDVLEGSREGAMGSTAGLDDDEMDALEAWLSSR